MRNCGGVWGFELDGVRASFQCGTVGQYRPEINATIIATDDRRFGTVQLDFVKAELRGVNQETSIGVEPNFIAGALRVSQHDLSDGRGAVSLGQQRDAAIEVQRQASLLVGLGGESWDDIQQERQVFRRKTEASLRRAGSGDGVLDARIAQKASDL